MTDSYEKVAAEIEAQIEEHRRAIERLQIGLGVVLQMGERPKARLKVIEHDRLIPPGAITIRRVAAAPEPVEEKKKRASDADRERRVAARNARRDEIVAKLAADGPMNTTSILEHLGLTDAPKAVKQDVYHIMHQLAASGLAQRDANYVYSIDRRPDDVTNH